MKEGKLQTADKGTQTLNRRILEIFRERKGEVISGEELSTMLGISRTAVWKHVEGLRKLGYTVSAVPAKGYRMVASPERLVADEIAAGLSTERIGTRIVCLDETDSTNNVAFRLAEEGTVEGTVVIADAQSRGKGRLGRSWASPKGVNLYCSVVLRPAVPPVAASQLTFLSVVAVARAIELTTPLKAWIKWPNDILIDGRKIAGLLNEMSAETEKVNFVVLGIGVNINMRREQFPPDLRHPASSLYLENGEELDRNRFICTLLRELDELYAIYLRLGYGPVREEWLSRSQLHGRKARIDAQNGSVIGIINGIDDMGALLLDMDGREERILSGDVTLL
ncbi:biotin--[acetyl-CoA-carboxylase] ligase [Geotalea sp. SG265]|uniref:biotin--[acetyl-CoA-carboxylase] ligase n=1 Tax=Geotalea sp. SG265 TaxID=2922867 RepID=UPI001FAF16D7|nr:biotin--[acetyl-CoA-carboxylase] ligase [Geotalea sp. SG265]